MRPVLFPRAALPHRAAAFPAASLPLLVCATALAPTTARAQQPTPDSAHAWPAADSARLPAPPPARDSVRAPAPDSAHGPVPPAADSTHASAIVLPRLPSPAPRPDSTCLRPGPMPLSCLFRVPRDSVGVRALFRGVGRRLLEHAAARAPARRPPRTPGEYFASAFGPRALMHSALTAGLEQAFGRPRRWPRTPRGYALRFGTRLATEALAAGVRYEMVSHLDEWMAPFEPCACTDPWARLAHALAAPFRAETPTGQHFSPLTPLTEVAGGMVLAGVASGGVRPTEGLTAGLTGMLSISLVAVIQEFRPWERWLK